MSDKFENIPAEMRGYHQWVNWRYEEREGDKPTKVPYSPLTGGHANVHKPETWGTYEEAVHALGNGWYSGIGFVLTEKDPYAFIDLDEPKNHDGSPLDPNEFALRFERQKMIFETFNSYAELSPSGKGLHIIVKGKIDSGRKRSSVEIYSDDRFMTMTGDVYRPGLITPHQEQLQSLWEEMGKGRDASLFYAGLEQATQSDDEIMAIATTASNKEKFIDLFFEGNYQKHNYPSQSEADFALMDIIAFYSKNAAQTQRIFLRSKLAEREKSRAQYRLNYMLARCFDKLLPPVDFEGLKNSINKAIDEKLKAQAQAKEINKEVAANMSAAISLQEEKAYLDLPMPAELQVDPTAIYSVPSGLVGQIAQFAYAQAPMPVPEIALTAAIGLMSGIVGKAYNISNTGLNQYTLLISSTGTGKEAIASSISKLMGEVKKTVIASQEFRGPAEIASPQALTRVLVDTPSIVSIVGEFGLALKSMAAENAAQHQVGLRRMLLDLYNKSGATDEVQRSVYADKDKNTTAIKAPAFSLIGESTPERFYDILTEEMVSEGLLPRFTIIENYTGYPEFNEGHALVKPSEELVKNLARLCANALNLIKNGVVINVQEEPEARAFLTEFRNFCAAHTRGTKMEVKKQLWTRAYVKALKLAATIAVGNNIYHPVITMQEAQWAVNLVKHGIYNIIGRFENGTIGPQTDENKQIETVMIKMKDFLLTPYSQIEKLAGNAKGLQKLHSERIIPYAYIQHAVAAMAVFKRDKMGSTNGLKRTLKTLVERGDITEVPRSDLAKIANTRSLCYMIENPGAFNL